MKTFFMKEECLCPTCGVLLNKATPVGHEQRPGPGDVTICFQCGEILLYGENLELKIPDLNDWNNLRQCPKEFLHALEAQRMVRAQRRQERAKEKAK